MQGLVMGFERVCAACVCRKDRITVQEREAEAAKQKELEQEAKRLAEERRKYTLKVPGGAGRMLVGSWAAGAVSV